MECPSQPIVRLRRSARVSKMINASRAVGKKPRGANPAHGQKKFLLWVQKTPRELSVWGGARNAVLDWHAEAQGRLSPVDATLLEDVMSFRISSISPPWLIQLTIKAVKNRPRVSDAARDMGSIVGGPAPCRHGSVQLLGCRARPSWHPGP